MRKLFQNRCIRVRGVRNHGLTRDIPRQGRSWSLPKPQGLLPLEWQVSPDRPLDPEPRQGQADPRHEADAKIQCNSLEPQCRTPQTWWARRLCLAREIHPEYPLPIERTVQHCLGAAEHHVTILGIPDFGVTTSAAKRNGAAYKHSRRRRKSNKHAKPVHVGSQAMWRYAPARNRAVNIISNGALFQAWFQGSGLRVGGGLGVSPGSESVELCRW